LQVKITIKDSKTKLENLECIQNYIMDTFNKRLESSENITQFKECTEIFKEMIQELLNNGIKLSRLTRGCLCLSFSFHSKDGVHRLWDLYTSGKLKEILHRGLITPDVLKECNVDSVQLEIYISEQEYEKYLTYKGMELMYFLAKDCIK